MQSPSDDKLLQFLQAVVRTIDTHWPATPLLQAEMRLDDVYTLHELREFLQNAITTERLGGVEMVSTADALWIYAMAARAPTALDISLAELPTPPVLLSFSPLIEFVASLIVDPELPVARTALASIPLPVATGIMMKVLTAPVPSDQVASASELSIRGPILLLPLESIAACISRGQISISVFGRVRIASRTLSAAFQSPPGTAAFDFACEFALTNCLDAADFRTPYLPMIALEAFRRAAQRRIVPDGEVHDTFFVLLTEGLRTADSNTRQQLLETAIDFWGGEQSSLTSLLDALSKDSLSIDDRAIVLRALTSRYGSDSDGIDDFTSFLSSCVVSNFTDVLRLLGRQTDAEVLAEAAENVASAWNGTATESDRNIILTELRTPLRALGRAVSNGRDLLDSGLDDEETLAALCFAENLLFDAKATQLEAAQRLDELIGGNEWHRRSDDLCLKCVNRLIEIIDELRDSWDEDVSSDALDSISGVLGDRLRQVLHEE
jgi:hypothetical protein